MVDVDASNRVDGMARNCFLDGVGDSSRTEERVKRHESVAEFLQEWVHIRPVTFFEITCCVEKARQNCHSELGKLSKRGVLEIETHRFGRREIPTYKLRRRVDLETVIQR
jgi:hypothetical protein